MLKIHSTCHQRVFDELFLITCCKQVLLRILRNVGRQRVLNESTSPTYLKQVLTVIL